MRLESLETFQLWARDTEIEAGCTELCEGRVENTLRFRTPEPHDRYWRTPYEPKVQLRFITALLDALGPWEFCWAIKREGAWSDLEEGEGLSEVLQLLQIPPGYPGAIRFEPQERAALAFLILTQIAYGWCGYYDLCVVPSHGRSIIRTDDDDITAVSCLDAPALEHFVQHLRAAGFELPQAPPDAGFYRQPWMGDSPAD